jgi:hypothetical protein
LAASIDDFPTVKNATALAHSPNGIWRPAHAPPRRTILRQLGNQLRNGHAPPIRPHGERMGVTQRFGHQPWCHFVNAWEMWIFQLLSG